MRAPFPSHCLPLLAWPAASLLSPFVHARLAPVAPQLITQNKGLYALLCAFNLCLRFIWALSLFGIASSPGGGMFFLESVEILRRTVWAIFRIEVRPASHHPRRTRYASAGGDACVRACRRARPCSCPRSSIPFMADLSFSLAPPPSSPICLGRARSGK